MGLSGILGALHQRLDNRNEWLNTHAAIAPFGAAITTWILTPLIGSGQWLIWRDWDKAASMAGLGTIVYGMLAVALERSLYMGLWAYDKWNRDKDERARMALITARDRIRENPNADPDDVLSEMVRELDQNIPKRRSK